MSKKSSSQPPQQHKTKEQLIKESEQRYEAERLRKIVKEQIYPVVVGASRNIIDANQFLAVLLMSIRQQFNNQMRKQTINDLKLLETMDMNADRAGEYKKVLEILQNETIGTATELIEGLGHAIESFVREENSKRSLETLQTDFL